LRDLADLSERSNNAVSYDMMSGYYHMGVHPVTRTFLGFFWEGRYFVYNCIPFGLSTAPWVFSKVMRELVTHWRKSGIRVLPYFDDFMLINSGFWQCARLARRVEKDFVKAGLKINAPKCSPVPAKQRRQLGSVVGFEEGKFQVPGDRFEALKAAVEGILSSRHGRAQARSLASVTRTVLFNALAQLYTRHLYALINSVWSLNGWVVLTEEVANELFLWKELPRLRFEGSI